MEYLQFPFVEFKYKNRKYVYPINYSDLTFQDDNDDWWDIWLKVGKRVYQICGKYEDGIRYIDDIIMYVYNSDDDLTDENRIDTITDCRIIYDK
jgi:hypothetical protein